VGPSTVIFQPLIEKLRRNLDGENIAINTQRRYWLEPCIEVLFADILANNFKTIVPYCSTAADFHLSSEFVRISVSFFRKGDKDVKKEIKKTSRVVLDFSEKYLLPKN
jgi:hypothetical protein